MTFVQIYSNDNVEHALPYKTEIRLSCLNIYWGELFTISSKYSIELNQKIADDKDILFEHVIDQMLQCHIRQINSLYNNIIVCSAKDFGV